MDSHDRRHPQYLRVTDGSVWCDAAVEQGFKEKSVGIYAEDKVKGIILNSTITAIGRILFLISLFFDNHWIDVGGDRVGHILCSTYSLAGKVAGRHLHKKRELQLLFLTRFRYSHLVVMVFYLMVVSALNECAVHHIKEASCIISICFTDWQSVS